MTSDVAEEALGKDPQTWLDSLSLNLKALPKVVFKSLDVGTPFFRKLTLSAMKDPLYEVAFQIRTAAVLNGDIDAAKHWAEEEYAPHVSLLYADLEIGEIKCKEILRNLEVAGIKLNMKGAPDANDSEGFDGWTGGRIVLVSTWKKLEKWAVIAERVL